MDTSSGFDILGDGWLGWLWTMLMKLSLGSWLGLRNTWFLRHTMPFEDNPVLYLRSGPQIPHKISPWPFLLMLSKSSIMDNWCRPALHSSRTACKTYAGLLAGLLISQAQEQTWATLTDRWVCWPSGVADGLPVILPNILTIPNLSISQTF